MSGRVRGGTLWAATGTVALASVNNEPSSIRLEAGRHGWRWVARLALLAGLLAHALAQPVQVTPVGQWPGNLNSLQATRGVALAGPYAYVVGGGGLHVIDVSNPVNPARVGSYDTPGSARGVAVAGNYAYEADDEAGLQVIDVSNPANPVRVGGYDTPGSAWGVAVAGNHAYVADGGAGLQVIDISNPARPVRVGGARTSGSAIGVAVAGSYAYMTDGRLQVIDVSNPANPVRVGGYDTPGVAWGVALAGHYAYVADEEAGLQVMDVSNPAKPVRVGGSDTPGYAYGVAVVGYHAYVADYHAGMQVIDVRNPTNPDRVGGADTPGMARGVAVAGNHVFLADGQWGLQILRIEGLAVPPPALSGVRAQQRPGTTLVDVDYELGPAGGDAAAVNVAFSRNGGLSYDLVPGPGALSGDAGGGVTVGARRLTWDAGQTLPVGNAGANFRARLAATNAGGSAGAESAVFALDLNRQPDLVVENVAFSPGAVTAGGEVTVSFRIRNTGPGACVATQARLRLSADEVLTKFDPPLSPLDVFIPSLAAGGWHDFTGRFTVPAGTPAGDYYVGVFADRDNRANQRDVVNDAGLSSTRLRVDGGGAARPVVTRQPRDQTVTAGETVVFSVEATGGGSLSFQWRFEGSRILGATGPSLTLTGVTRRQAGVYTVEMSNAGGTTASEPARLDVNPAPDAPPPLPTQPTRGELAAAGFDPKLPTVVITHGWQPCEIDWDCTPELPAWMTAMKAAIEKRLQDEGLPPNAHGQRANVIAFRWNEAWTPFPHRAAAFAYDVGFALANHLKEEVPQDYGGKMHFIGHSLGTVVNAVAINQLLSVRPQLTVHQVTILDAPILLAGVDENTFHELLRPDDRILWVDNYIAAGGSGRPIWGTAPGGGMHLVTSHVGINDLYTETITGRAGTWGFFHSALLPHWGSRPAPQKWIASPRPTTLFSGIGEGALTVLDGFRVVGGFVAQDVPALIGGATRSVIRLMRGVLPLKTGQVQLAGPDELAGTNSAFALDLAVPAGATTLTFDFLFASPGNGDWLTVEFNEELLWSFRGEEFPGADFQRATVQIGHLAGQTGVLTVTLQGVGDKPAEVLLDDFEFRGPARLHLEAPRRLDNGRFEFQLIGELAGSYRIESSTNLVNWQGLTNVLCTTPSVTITDAAAAGLSPRFYRAVLVP